MALDYSFRWVLTALSIAIANSHRSVSTSLNSIEIVYWYMESVKAGSHRNDYERVQLKTDLRLVKIIKSKGKHFHSLTDIFSNDFVK